ncbi:hypothetical protein GCM10007147_10720 [Nocardiopsis kunsanensis]|uniref:Uncharacterized protein n=1 Tax=Nocardiopsis kunsanensis TaxID=141693 RepID=A0A919CFY8_9ACTN|nr:hypothetical protein GCM10007147_10720 [Nocardiopsis kunsanensis]
MGVEVVEGGFGVDFPVQGQDLGVWGGGLVFVWCWWGGRGGAGAACAGAGQIGEGGEQGVAVFAGHGFGVELQAPAGEVAVGQAHQDAVFCVGGGV